MTRHSFTILLFVLAIACGGRDAVGPGGDPGVPLVPDTIGPAIVIQPHDSVTASRSFTLSGTASDTSDVVTVAIAQRSDACCISILDTVVRARGRSVEFSRAYTLVEGNQQFSVMATDGKGNTRTTMVSVRSDQTPPELYVIAPWSVPGDSARIGINGRAAPEPTLALAYSVNGGPSIPVSQLTGTLEPYPFSPRRYEFISAFNVPVIGDSEAVTIFLRDATGNSASSLVHVRRRSAIEQLDIGGHGCFLRDGGTAYCWGPNSYGELGTGDTRPTAHPTPVVGNLRFRSISTGYSRTCAVTTSGVGYCWGTFFPAVGQPVVPVVAPDSLAGGVRFSTIGVSGYHACGLAVDASAYCWGEDAAALAADSTAAAHDVPVRIQSDVPFDSVSVGGSHACALAKSGAAYCWGSNYRGALGIGSFGDTVPVTKPVEANPGHRYTSVQASHDATCGIEPGGIVYCWGDNFDHNFGAYLGPFSVATPVRVELPEPVAAFSRGENGCAIGQSGAAYCWGWNYNTRLGRLFYNTFYGYELYPMPVAIGITLHDIHPGVQTCARTADGALYCWGDPTMASVLER